ncbi:MAG: DNA-3-methyladenine glycosylase [Actinomycetota bacterium]
MPRSRPLPRSFYARPSPEVAPDLLGRILIRRLPDGRRLSARIVETEAYQEGDPASHSYRGRTRRTEVMFGRPGHLYVYFTYGMHFCMNVVTGQDGEGSAVLLRAAEPVEGLEDMARRRSASDPRLLCSGPARLCEALGVARAENGTDLVRGGHLWVLPGEPVPPSRIGVTARVGIRDGMDRGWRFLVTGDPFVSRGRPVAGIRG